MHTLATGRHTAGNAPTAPTPTADGHRASTPLGSPATTRDLTVAERPAGAPPSPRPSALPPPPMQPTSLIQRHAVLIYFVLTLALSWGSLLLLTGGLGPLGASTFGSDPRFMLAVLAAPFFPASVGILLTGLLSGRTGLREMRSRVLRWQAGARWYAVALLLAPLSMLGADALLALSLRSPAFLPAIFSRPDPTGLLLPGLVAGLLVGVGEELGWTGFAIPRLRLRYGVFATGLLVSVPWGVWHFPLFRETDSFSGALPLAFLFLRLFAWLPAYRVLMVWIYDRTGSLLLAMLMHVSLTASQMSLQPGALSDVQSMTGLIVWAGSLWAAVAAVAMVSGGQLTRQPLRARVS